MKLSDIEVGKQAGDKVTLTRTSWNKKFLEFWVELEWYEYTKPQFRTGFSRPVTDFTKPDTRSVTLDYRTESFARCKDGTVVSDAFALDVYDLEADDWVII